jgi:hypothetical protein
MVSIEEVDKLARLPHSVVISVQMKLNLDRLLEMMWAYMGLIRVYTKKRGMAPDLVEPVVLSTQREGVTVQALTSGVSSELLAVFGFAYVWGEEARAHETKYIFVPMRRPIIMQLVEHTR